MSKVCLTVATNPIHCTPRPLQGCSYQQRETPSKSGDKQNWRLPPNKSGGCRSTGVVCGA